MITESWQGLYYLHNNPTPGIKMLQPALATKRKHLHLHKKYRHLEPKLSAALLEMKRDGTYQKIVDKVLTPLNIR